MRKRGSNGEKLPICVDAVIENCLMVIFLDIPTLFFIGCGVYVLGQFLGICK